MGKIIFRKIAGHVVPIFEHKGISAPLSGVTRGRAVIQKHAKELYNELGSRAHNASALFTAKKSYGIKLGADIRDLVKRLKKNG